MGKVTPLFSVSEVLEMLVGGEDEVLTALICNNSWKRVKMKLL